MQVTARIKRLNPEKGKRPHWAEYRLMVAPTGRVLDLLRQVKWEHDATLALRRSRAHGICGFDAMLINGVNRLACKALVRDLGNAISVEPIRGLPALKDLIVDMGPFFDA